MNTDLSFGTWLRQRRRLMDLTQKELATQVSCAPITLRRIEADELKPSKELALALLEKIGVSLAEREPWLRFARGVSGMPDKPLATTPELQEKASSQLTLPIGTVIFLYSDLVGFTRRYERDPEATLDMLAQHDRLLHPMMAEFGGQVFNVRGDNFAVAFIDPLKAVEAAIQARFLVAQADWGDIGLVQTRMTLHVGQAKRHPGGGYVSLSLAFLEPMEKYTENGEIVLSQAMADTVRAHLPPKVQLMDLGEHVILAREPALHLYQLVLSE